MPPVTGPSRVAPATTQTAGCRAFSPGWRCGEHDRRGEPGEETRAVQAEGRLVDYKTIKRLQSKDGLLHVDIMRSPQGLFRFVEQTYITEDGHSFWTPVAVSGLYASAEEAEQAVRRELPWLRDENSN